MKSTVDRLLGNVLIVLMAVVVLDVLWGVFTRKVLGDQAGWTEELARFLLIWISLLGAAWAAGKGLHLSITILPDRLVGANRKRLYRVIHSLVILFVFSVMVIGGARLMWLTYYLGQTSAALKLPMAVVYAVVPLSGLLIVYYKLIDLKSTQ